MYGSKLYGAFPPGAIGKMRGGAVYCARREVLRHKGRKARKGRKETPRKARSGEGERPREPPNAFHVCHKGHKSLPRCGRVALVATVFLPRAEPQRRREVWIHNGNQARSGVGGTQLIASIVCHLASVINDAHPANLAYSRPPRPSPAPAQPRQGLSMVAPGSRRDRAATGGWASNGMEPRRGSPTGQRRDRESRCRETPTGFGFLSRHTPGRRCRANRGLQS